MQELSRHLATIMKGFYYVLFFGNITYDKTFFKFIVLAPSIPRFKGLGMRNLQYQIRICEKSHNTVTNHNNILCMVRIFMNQTLAPIEKQFLAHKI